MIGGIWLGEIGEATACVIEVTAIYNHATNGRAVATEELSCAMSDDVGAPLKGAAEVGRGEGAVNHNGDIVRPPNVGHFLEGEDGDIGIAQRFTVNNLRVGLDGGGEFFRLSGIHKGGFDAHAREGVTELIEGTTIQAAAADDMIALPTKRHDRHHLCNVATTSRQRTNAPFEIGYTLLHHVVGGVHDARVDVAELFQPKEVGRMFRIVKLIAGGVINGHGTAACRWVGLLTSMKLAGTKTICSFVFTHCISPESLGMILWTTIFVNNYLKYGYNGCTLSIH